ncbi:MAG: hypothetical protein OXQ90_09685 [Gammaproteobacteria bacterium]|nr:hypothetical protein [Gammaproteobacteria bacterium]
MDAIPTYVAPRTCTTVDEGTAARDAKTTSAPLDHYADAAAYVLIAEPGAGKTTAFRTEAERPEATFVTVRNFRTFDDKPEWHGTTLFLDGLDESRAGTQDGRTPLDDVRKKLNRLGRPRFRLSCRWADWMAANDKDALKEVSPDGTVTVIRLDPLSKEDIKTILTKRHGVEDPEGFVAAARKRGVHRLLTNPQNLDLMAKAVSGGAWPDSQKETFELACQMLVGEPNGEHLAANSCSADKGPLIEAAGRLCAAQLLSGVAGYTLRDRAEPDADYPSFTEVASDATKGATRNVLGTRLFEGTSEGKLAPAHRQIAEFLAARHVSALIDDGELPLQRVLALITGFDGELVPSFGIFASWLAVHNKRSRKRLGRLDASGLIYAGDRQTYSAGEKRDLVRNLRRESYRNPWCSRALSMVSGIGAIVSPELEGTFREILTDAARAADHQSYVMLLMQMLADGEPLPVLADVLEQTVRDPTWKHGVRCAAFDVLTGYHARGHLEHAALKRMAAEIEEGSIDDPQDELLGILLTALYPTVLSTAEVLRHFRKPKFAEAGEYVDFWARHVPEKSTPEQAADLLDAITAKFDDYKPFLAGDLGWRSGMGQLPADLLRRALRERNRPESGTGVAVDRLHRWMGVVSNPEMMLADWRTDLVRLDLQWNSDLLKALIVHGVEARLRRGEECTDLVSRRLFGARPWGYGPWCLQMAIAANEITASSFYLRELYDCVVDGVRADGLTVDAARARLASHAALLNQFDELVEARARGETRPGHPTTPASSVDAASPEDTAEQRKWQAAIEARVQALRTGRGTEQLLHRAAEAYLGVDDSSATKTPRERLGDLVGSRTDLIDLLSAGMERTITREDLPSCDEVVRLFDRNRINWLVLPFMAGLHSLERSGRLAATDLNESQIRLGITILYLLPRKFFDPDSVDEISTYRPEWFRTLLRDNPARVADVIRRSAAQKLETEVQPAIELRELADAEDHRDVAALAALPILERFPKAATEVTLMALCWSLNAALTRCDWSDLDRVIEERLGNTHLAPEERICWLTAGLLVAPERYREDFRTLAADESCLKWLSGFVAVRFRTHLVRRLLPCDVASLVGAMGAALRIHGLPERAYWSTSDVIGTLGDDPSRAATETLEALATIPEAQPWSPAITHVAERQATKRREHEYRHSDIAQVVETLDNRTPANAGDLAALVFDHLKEISGRIRHGSTSDWRHYWNVDRHNLPTNPRPEGACRHAILSNLQERLERLGIDAQPESVYADDNRSDIRVSFPGFNVPVEIKRSCHRDLWTAVRSQLIAKYTRDPGAAGHGIYLVFWFGDTEKCRPTKCAGWTPETPEDVRLKIEQSLDDREGSLISVLVVDVSAPHRHRSQG